MCSHVFRHRRLLLLLGLFASSQIAQSRAAESSAISTNRFHPLPLERFYQRTLSSYRTNEPLAAVPGGLVEIDGVPFRMFGKIEMNGLGPTRNNNFLPPRIGEIPIGR